MDTKQLKILSLPVDRGGCGWYRVRQPFQAINDYTTSQAEVIEGEHDKMIAYVEALCVADILVVRQGGEVGVMPLIDAANDYARETHLPQGFHAKIVLDIDDNIELISPYSEHYGEYGTKNFKDIWEEGKTKDFTLTSNRDRIMSLMLGMRRADMISVTTDKLAAYARLFNKNVCVLPNVIDKKQWWKLPLRPNKQLRIGWSGGHSHYEDWYTIKQPLNNLLRKHKFTLVLAGTAFDGLIDKDLRKYIEVMPWVNFEAHSYRTMAMNLDAAIIPLADAPFNHYKSAIKWLEFSSIGVPCVTANVSPYKEVVSPLVKEPFLYASAGEFYSLLESLITTPLLREKLGNSAMNSVRQIYTTKATAQRWIDAYSAIL